jgi:signal transduction histidine kinase
MGLWLVRQLVTRHGGTIEVDSAPEKGTRFSITWPRRIPQDKAVEQSMTTGAGK